MIIAKRVTTNVGNANATIEYYTADNHLTIMVNGISANFNLQYGEATTPDDTIAALKEAVSAL